MPGSSGARAGGATPAAFFHRKPEDRALVGTEKVWERCRGRLSCRGQVGGAVSLPQAVQGGAPSLPTPPKQALCEAALRASQSRYPEAVVSTKAGPPRGLPACCPPPCPARQEVCPLAAHPLALPASPPCPSPLVAPAMVGRLTQIKTIIFFFSNLLGLFKNGKAPVIPVPPSYLSDKNHRGANDHY